MIKIISFDEKSYDLAEHFLEDEQLDSEHSRQELASVIQQAIEDWFEDKER